MKKFWYYLFIIILGYITLGFIFVSGKELNPYSGIEFNIGYFLSIIIITGLMIFGIYKCIKKIKEKKEK
jgi:hypothetical protein